MIKITDINANGDAVYNTGYDVIYDGNGSDVGTPPATVPHTEKTIVAVLDKDR